MKKAIGIAIGSAALLGMSPAVASAQTDTGWTPTSGPYVGGGVGGAFPFDANFDHAHDNAPGAPGATGRASLEPNWMGFGEVGYGWGEGFRTELEGSYTRNAVSGTKYNAGSSGRLRSWDMFVNGLYDFDLGLPVTPHLGLGIGFVNAALHNVGPFAGNAVSGTQNLLAGQAIAGVDYQLTSNIKVGLDYRFIGTDTGNFGATPVGGRSQTSFATNEVTLGLRWEFNQPPLAPQPMQAAAVQTIAPAPPPPPRVEKARSFQVFFDFDKSNITAAAAKVIQSAADAVRMGNVVQITVTGHTDTVGTAAYNQGLSERRSSAVKQQLVSDGVSGGEITTIGVGKTGLLVPTADGVREPQNRRAEIVLQ